LAADHKTDLQICANYPLGMRIAPMERALAYVISAGIVGFGVWILIAGLSTIAPALWACAALIPIAIGLLSAFDEC
jgi:hypothetical protein